MKRAKMKVVSFEAADVIATSGGSTTSACTEKLAHWVKNDGQDGTAYDFVNGAFVNINNSTFGSFERGTDYYSVSSSHPYFGNYQAVNGVNGIPAGTWYVGNAATFAGSTSWEVCNLTHNHFN